MIASDFEPQKAICSSNYPLFLECGVPYVSVLLNSLLNLRKNLKELKAYIALILKGIRELNIINLFPLEFLLEDF